LKKIEIKNQVIRFVNNTKYIPVAQNFLNAVADTVDTVRDESLMNLGGRGQDANQGHN
jgi:hypothetical protein